MNAAVEKNANGYPAPHFNKVTLIGKVESVDVRESGAAFVRIVASNRKEDKMANAPTPSKFTPVFSCRIPAKMVENIDPTLLIAGNIVVADAVLQGVCREVEGRDWYTTEVQLTRLRPLFEQQPEGDFPVPHYHEVSMIGVVREIDIRDSGAAMIWIEAGTREEEIMHKAPTPSKFTPIFNCRIPAKVVENLDPSLLTAGSVVVVDSKLQGICREIEGTEFYTTEVQITRMRPFFN